MTNIPSVGEAFAPAIAEFDAHADRINAVIDIPMEVETMTVLLNARLGEDPKLLEGAAVAASYLITFCAIAQIRLREEEDLTAEERKAMTAGLEMAGTMLAAMSRKARTIVGDRVWD